MYFADSKQALEYLLYQMSDELILTTFSFRPGE